MVKMIYLLIGVALFCGVHLFPAAVALRQRLILKIGENPYKGLFSILALTGIILVVIGYQRVELSHVYDPPVWGRTVTAILMLFSLILFAAANMPGNIKRFTRHPMLWGLVLWAVGHLLANGDKASVILFGSFAVFALIAMLSANIRGATKQTVKLPVQKDIMIIVSGVVVYVVLIFAHPYLFGVSVG
jgi:uncharacterized membrane protein